MLKPGGGPSNWKLPLSTARSASIWAAGQSVRLARVRLRVRRPSRQPSRRRIAGRELRLGTVSMYMAAKYHIQPTISSRQNAFTWEPFPALKNAFPFYNRGLMLDFEPLKAGVRPSQCFGVLELADAYQIFQLVRR